MVARERKPVPQITLLRREVDRLRREIEDHKAESERAIKAILEQIARLPGARGSLPPPRG